MSRQSDSHTAVAAAEVLDPVCGMTISPDDAVGHVERSGQTYYFCASTCKDKFALTPEQYVGTSAGRPKSGHGCCS